MRNNGNENKYIRSTQDTNVQFKHKKGMGEEYWPRRGGRRCREATVAKELNKDMSHNKIGNQYKET